MLSRLIQGITISTAVLFSAAPMVSTSMSTDNGGTKSAVDAYSDGGGVLIINQSADTQIDNSPMNKLVFKYGEGAKYSNTTLKNQVTVIEPSATSLEKANALKLELAKTVINPPSNGTSCDDGNPNTISDTYLGGICAGTPSTLNIVDLFGDGSGKNLYNFNQNNNDLAGNLNLPTGGNYVLGKFGNGNNFSAPAVSQTKPSWLNLQAPYTFSGWVASTNATNYQIFMINDWHVLQFNAATKKYTCNIYSAPAWYNAVSTVTISDSNFHNVVCGYDGARSFISVDGEPLVKVNMPTPGIYAAQFGVAYTYSNTALDHVRMFNKAVSQAEVTKLNTEQ